MKRLISIAGILLVAFVSCKTITPVQDVKDNPLKSNPDTSGRLSTFNGDTVKYLNNLIRQKQKYIGQPLSLFLADLESPIISFVAGSTLNKKENGTISLYTCDQNTYLTKYSNIAASAIEIIVDWQSIHPMDSIRAIRENNKKDGKHPGAWSNQAKDYFSRLIVGNIKLPYYLVK